MIIKRWYLMVPKSVKRLIDNSKKNGIMREASHKFHNADFIEKMDQNPYLLDLKNGVVDFKEKCFQGISWRLYHKVYKDGLYSKREN